jgi:hypothetical protein
LSDFKDDKYQEMKDACDSTYYVYGSDGDSDASCNATSMHDDGDEESEDHEEQDDQEEEEEEEEDEES